MKPGPAISTLSTSGSSASDSTMLVAISRGLLRAGFASRMAILLAKSPWLASRVRSTVPSIENSAAASATSGRLASALETSSATICFILQVFTDMARIGEAQFYPDIFPVSEQFDRVHVDGPAYFAGGGMFFEERP